MPAPLLVAAVPAILKIGEKIIDNLFPNKVEQEKERAAAQQALLSMTREADLAELQVTLSAILAEAQSQDPWTSRARPTFLYVIYFVILLCVTGAIIGIWWPDKVTTAATNLTMLLNGIPESLWWLFGAGYLGYSASRSFDKWKTGTMTR